MPEFRITMSSLKSLGFRIAQVTDLKKTQTLERLAKSFGYQNYRSLKADLETREIQVSIEKLFVSIMDFSGLEEEKVKRIIESEYSQQRY